MNLLIFFLVLPAVFSLQWFDCDPSYFYRPTSSRTTDITSPLSRKAREISREYHSNQIKESLKKRAVAFKSKCTIMRTPVNHDSNNNLFIDVFLKCYSKTESSTGQMWFIQGGPGASSIAMEQFMSEAMERVGDTYDACTFDFRGVFRSTGLYCYANQAETPGSEDMCDISDKEAADCRKGVELSYNLSDFTTTQAAKDIKMAIDAVGKPKVVLYGVSYGTYLLGRFTQIYPNVGEVLIFDSVVNLAGDYLMTFDKWDEVNNNVMNELLKLCKLDSFCVGKLGSDPKAFAIETLNKVFAVDSTCPGIKEIFTNKAILISTIQGFIQDLILRPLFTTFLYRMNRCSSWDIRFVEAMVDWDDSSPTYCSEETSGVVYNNVAFGELWDGTLTEQNIIDKGESLDFNGMSAYQLFTLRESWSTVSRKDYYNQKLSPTGKVLVLQSELDPQTPLISGKNFFDFLNVSTQQKHFGVVKGGVHVAAFAIAVDNNLGRFIYCGLDVMFNFVKEPNKAPDFTCLGNTFNDDFEGLVLASELGIDDLYESRFSSASITLPVGLMSLVSIFLLLL